VLLVICALGLFLWGCAPNPLTVSRQVVFATGLKTRCKRSGCLPVEYGVSVLFEPYASQEQLIEELKTGITVRCHRDDNQLVPQLIEQRLLAELDLQHILNYTYLSHNFVDKSFDPGNRILCRTPGNFRLIVKTDPGRVKLQSGPIFGIRLSRQLVLWTATPRYTVGAALIALGIPRIQKTRRAWRPLLTAD